MQYRAAHLKTNILFHTLLDSISLFLYLNFWAAYTPAQSCKNTGKKKMVENFYLKRHTQILIRILLWMTIITT